MSLQASMNKCSEDVEERSISKGYSSYSLFVLMLPAFFIFPLALFSLQEWWQVWSEQSATAMTLSNIQPGVWQTGQTLATYGWTAFVQGVCWLAFVVLAGLGFLLKRSPLIGGAYPVLLIS